jgi:uncharacterized membrane protein
VKRTEKRLESETVHAERNESKSKSSACTHLLHCVFQIGVVAKGVDGALELIVGVLLLLLPAAAIRGVILFLVQGELNEDPTDRVATLLVHNTGRIIQSRTSASVFLIIHGAVKLGLAGGLVTNQLWSYPAAIVVFTGLAIYQVYQIAHHYSLFLTAITALDVIVVLLVIAEYRQVRLAR